MARALTVTDLLKKRYETLRWTGPLQEAFGNPETTGTWTLWADSANGKSDLAMQLAKALSSEGSVLFNALEEKTRLSVQENAIRNGLSSAPGKILFICEPMDELIRRLEKQRSPRIVIVDSLQYADMTYRDVQDYKRRFEETKLTIFTSHADGTQPDGRVAKKVAYHSDLKIYVKGFKAFSKGRFYGPNGGHYDIWPDGAAQYHGVTG